MITNQGDATMDRNRHTILIADDDADILELVRLRLSRSGYETIVARDGAEALALAILHRPALALLDVSMPHMDGYEVTRQLRATPATHDIGIVLLTARAQTAEVACGFEAGADDYITKPFSPAELNARVEAMLARDASSSHDRYGDTIAAVSAVG